MIYISLLVHENKYAAIDTIRNFLKYVPNSTIVLHISKNANFKSDQIRELLINKAVADRVVINTEPVCTEWGNIIAAHISNIKCINSICSDRTSKVVFHSSGDMLVRLGAESYIENNEFIYHTRIYEQPGYWWPSHVALSDCILMHSLQRFSMKFIVASQIEGASYPLEVLLNVLKLLEKDEILNCSKGFYPREEIYFSSFVYGMGYSSLGDPYIYSEVHRFDSKLWKIFRTLDSEDNFLLYFLRHKKGIIDKLYKKYGKYRITERDVNLILSNNPEPVEVFDCGKVWRPYLSPEKIFGVKRVERTLNNDLRNYINKLN